jgi:hypothetical protein
MPRFIVHVGTHKTGSTSIQKFLSENESYLAANNLAFVSGLDGKPNFKDLFHGSCRRDRRQLMNLRKPKLKNRIFRNFRLKRRLATAASKSGGKTVIVSTELLSMLREADEIKKLSTFFPKNSEFEVVVVLREKKSFLASFQRQIRAQGKHESDQQGHASYVKPDSWLTDYLAIQETFRLLTPKITVIDYNAAMASDANIIASFMRAIGADHLPNKATLPFLNRR